MVTKGYNDHELGALLAGELAVVLEPGSVIGEEFGGPDPRLHLCNLVLDKLEFADGPAEGLTIPCILETRLERTLGKAHAQTRNHCPDFTQYVVQVLCSLAFDAEEVFPGDPALVQSTAAYARDLMERHSPTGPVVALLTGCLMEALFREINFATVRVLIKNNIRVVVPEGCAPAWWIYGMLAADADGLIEHCAAHGIETTRLWRRNDTYSCFRESAGTPLPGMDTVAGHAVFIPSGWWVTDSDRDTIAEQVIRFQQHHAAL